MKKLLVLIILVVAGSPFFAHSQGVSVGVKTGMNLSNVYAEDYYDTDYIPGFIFGGYVNYNLKGSLFYSPEVMYSHQGYYAYIDDWVLNNTELKMHLHYLNFLPLTAKWYFGEVKLVNILLGPQLGWLMKGTSKITTDSESMKYAVTEFSRFDFSAVLGLGVDLKSGMNFGCRMNLGLIDLRGWDGDNPYIRNIVFQAHIGYTFINR